jgi:hypothetical protein
MMLLKTTPLSFDDILGLAATFLCWPILLLSTSKSVLNRQRALKLYDAQKINSPLALPPSAPQQEFTWWRRYRQAGPKEWWLAALIHERNFIFMFLIFIPLILTFRVKDGEKLLPMWLNTHFPDPILVLVLWHTLVSRGRSGLSGFIDFDIVEHIFSIIFDFA